MQYLASEKMYALTTNTAYLICMALAALISAYLYSLRLRSLTGKRTAGIEATLLTAVVMGTLFAKAFYLVTSFSFEKWLAFDTPDSFSIWGGVFGVCLAVSLCAPLNGVKRTQALNAFAPAGAVMLCLARMSEAVLNPQLAFGMTQIGNSSQLVEDLWHVCFLEGGIALLVAVLSATVLRKHTFMRTLYMLMAFQLLTELLQDHSLRLGGLVFVRIEQILCAVSMLVMLCVHARHGISTRAGKRFAPAILFLLPIGLITYAEFELDKGWLNEALWNTFMNPQTYDVPDWVASVYDAHTFIWYGVILLAVLWALLLERSVLKHRAD